MGNTRLYDKSFNWAIIAEHFLYIDTRWDVHDGTKEIRFSAHTFSLWLILKLSSMCLSTPNKVFYGWTLVKLHQRRIVISKISRMLEIALNLMYAIL